MNNFDTECDRMNEGYTVWGAMKCVLSKRESSVNTKLGLDKGVIVPTVLYWTATRDTRRDY